MKMEGAPNLEWINIEPQKLLLDPSPYQRLTGSLGIVPEDRYADSAVQVQLLENYENSEGVQLDQLIKSILAVGFIDISPMFVREFSDTGKYIVLEGNRRLAAIRHILANEKDYRDQYPNSLKTLRTIEVVNVGDISNEDFCKLLATKNVLSRPKTPFSGGAPKSNEKALRDSLRETSERCDLDPATKEEFDALRQVIEEKDREIEGLKEKLNPPLSQQIKNLISQGETKTTEFKEALSLDVKKQKKEKYIEESALKTIVAFLNSDGGSLLIGVSDDGRIDGVDAEVGKLHKKSRDNFQKHFKNLQKIRSAKSFIHLLTLN